MKLKRFIEILNEKNEEEFDDFEDKNAIESYIRTFFSKKKIQAEAEFITKQDGEVLEVRFIRPFSDNLSSLLNMMEAIDQLDEEMLGEYDNNFDLWYTKNEKKPIFTLTFYV